jgi:hypothetical protein
VAVIDELARGERGRREFEAIDDAIEPALQQRHQVVAGVALPAPRLLVDAAELALADIAVIALELLLRHELRAEVGRLLAALPVLAGTVVAVAIERALAAAPEIDAEAAVDLVFRP